MRVALLTDFPTALRRRRRLLVGDDLRPLDVRSVQIQGDHALISFDEVDTREAAEALRNSVLYVPVADAARPRRGEHYWHEIIGLRVIDPDGQEVGRVESILRTGSNDVYVVQGPKGEILIPAIEDAVARIDIAKGHLTLRPMPGLLPGERSD